MDVLSSIRGFPVEEPKEQVIWLGEEAQPLYGPRTTEDIALENEPQLRFDWENAHNEEPTHSYPDARADRETALAGRVARPSHQALPRSSRKPPTLLEHSAPIEGENAPQDACAP